MAVEPQERAARGMSNTGGWRVAAWRVFFGSWFERAFHVDARRSREPAGRVSGAFERAIEREVGHGTAFVALAGLAIAGAATYFALPFEPGLLMPAAMLVAAIAAWFALGVAGPGKTVCAVLIALLAGMIAGALETRRAAPTMLGSEISTRLTARVAAIEDRANGRVRLTLDVIGTRRPELRYAPERLRATARSVPDELSVGSIVEGVVRLLPATGPARPQGYDFAFEAYHAGIGSSGFFLSGPLLSGDQQPAGRLRRMAEAVETLRMNLTDHVRDRIGGPEGEIAAALITGVRGGISEADNEALRRTGLAHFISISGLHMALVTATVLVGVRGFFAILPMFSSRRPVKKYAAVIALVAIAAYLLVSGQQVAAQRSFLMCAVMLTAVLFDRAALTMRNLAIAAIIMVAIAPHEVMGPSFQMSFAATAALIAAYAWHSERRRLRGRRGTADFGGAIGIVRPALLFLVGLAATSIIAGLATTIFGVWHFQRVSPLGLIANLAAMPIVTIAVMPMAVIGVLLTPLGLDAPFFTVMGWGLGAVMDIARWLSARSPIDAVGAISPAAVALLAAGLGVATVATTAVFRACSLPFLAAGLALVVMRELPDVLISEDARLVAMRLDDGRLAVNRQRPSAFTLGNWSYAVAATGVAKPHIDNDSEAASVPLHDTGAPGSPFSCSADLCLARHASGAAIVHARDAASAKSACGVARVIIIDDATAQNPCMEAGILVLTKQDMARRGSAAIFLNAGDAPQVEFAVAHEPRIWHRQRRFSREARGLAPYRRAAQASAEKAADDD